MTRTHRLAAAAAAVLLLLAASGCGGRADRAALPPPSAAPPRAVRVAKPSQRVDTALGRATGVVRSRDEDMDARARIPLDGEHGGFGSQEPGSGTRRATGIGAACGRSDAPNPES